MHLECTKLYGTAMRQPLPYTGFCYKKSILEIDLGYPTHLYNLHTDYPLVPECRIVTENTLSLYKTFTYLKNLLNWGHLSSLWIIFMAKSFSMNDLYALSIDIYM